MERLWFTTDVLPRGSARVMLPGEGGWGSARVPGGRGEGGGRVISLYIRGMESLEAGALKSEIPHKGI